MNTLGFPGANRPILPQGGLAQQMPQAQPQIPQGPVVMGQHTPVMPPPVITIPVSPGDSLRAIAQRYGTTVQTIQYMNGIRNPDEIFAGRQLTVPNPRMRPQGGLSGGMPQPPQGQDIEVLLQQIMGNR